MDKARAFFSVCAALLGLAPLLPRPAAAAWPSDPLVNLPVCTAMGSQQYPTIVADGAGGTIVTWQDARSGNYDIYTQRISADGTFRWAADGVPLCTRSGEQSHPTIASDGAGGAIVTWRDLRSSTNDGIYAQRVSAGGAGQWTTHGVALCTHAGAQQGPVIVSDGAGGAIVTWQDERSGNDYDIYAQRISAGGAVQWTVDGVALCTAPGLQDPPTVLSDGAGGAIVIWQDFRSGNDHDIYAQRISVDGTVQWAANGVLLCTAPGDQQTPAITSDGAGGAIVTWSDSRTGGIYHIYSQRISADGTVLWPADGVALCTAPPTQLSPAITSDGAGGAVVTWSDLRNGSNWDIYAQRISASGAVPWEANGVALCSAPGDQQYPTVTSGGAGGAIVTWRDWRGGLDDVLYSQRISAGGAVQWSVDGVALCTATRSQRYPNSVSDGAGGAIVTWDDWRSGPTSDIYAQNVNADGTLGGVATPVLLSFVSADAGADGVKLTWFTGGSMSAAATVYRSTAGDEWARIGEAILDGAGYLRYEDRIAAIATRVGYRLGIVDAGIESFYGETWIDLPALELTLQGVRPNPAPGGSLTVHFTLPGAAPARIELVDASGRRVVEREVGPLGAGQHALDLGAGLHLAPGVYLVCLRQGTDTRVRRVAVLN